MTPVPHQIGYAGDHAALLAHAEHHTRSSTPNAVLGDPARIVGPPGALTVRASHPGAPADRNRREASAVAVVSLGARATYRTTQAAKGAGWRWYQAPAPPLLGGVTRRRRS